jgi:hypothetical protein
MASVIEMQMVELLIPEPSFFEAEIAVKNLETFYV